MEKDCYAVIGDPVAHSLSPQMQNPAIQAMGIHAEYIAIHVREGDLAVFTEKARHELRGFNITVPHKSEIVPFLDSLSDECRLSESVNTVTVKDGLLHGESTDGYGLETAIREAFGIPVGKKRFCFLGCGGAALAVAFHFAAKGAASLAFVNRTQSTAERLAADLADEFPGTETVAASPADTGRVRDLIANAAVTIQATSLGLKPTDPPPIDPKLLEGTNTCFYETIYLETALLRHARKSGLRCADGRGMLLHQGVKSLSIWTGRNDVPVEIMRKALDDAIAARISG